METRLERTCRHRKRCYGSSVITINIIHSFTYVFSSMSMPLVSLFFPCLCFEYLHLRATCSPSFSSVSAWILIPSSSSIIVFSHSVTYYYIEPLFTSIHEGFIWKSSHSTMDTLVCTPTQNRQKCLSGHFFEWSWAYDTRTVYEIERMKYRIGLRLNESTFTARQCIH